MVARRIGVLRRMTYASPAISRGLDRPPISMRPSYISADLAEWLDKRNMDHVRGAPCHPQTQGKIERLHQTLENRILLENYYLPGDLEARIDTS
jgi:transposase InsO family protein